MTFRIEVDRQPLKFMKKADAILAKRILKKIDELKNNPVPHDSKRVVNRKETTFRVRVGDYRMLYVIFYEEKYIFISKIDKRQRVY